MTAFRTLIASLAAAAPLALAAPAAAQETSAQSAEETVNLVIVYGDDSCPESTADQIVVCARQAENERYRIPADLRFDTDPSTQAWAQRVEKLEMVGSFGTMSCSPSGLGGFTGCTQQMIRDAYADKAQGKEIRFAELVNRARAERAAGIDAAAEEEQRRVEMIEREYMERLERERAGEVPGEASDQPLPQPEGASQPQG